MADIRTLLTVARRRAVLLKRQIALAIVLTVVAVGFIASALSSNSPANGADAARVNLNVR